MSYTTLYLGGRTSTYVVRAKTVIALVLSIILSTVALMLSLDGVLLLLIAVVIAAVITLRHSLITPFKYLTTFVLPYVILGLSLQVVLGVLDLEMLCTHIARIAAIYFASLTTLRYVSIAELFNMFSRLRYELALVICMAIKLLIDGGELINELRTIYSTNLGSSGLRRKVTMVVSLTRALSKSLTIRAISMAEAIYVRYVVRSIKEPNS